MRSENSFARASWPARSSARLRASARSPVMLFSRSLRVFETTSPPNSAPIRIPIASARKTAARDAA
jgi:hypothetical protein